MENREFKEREPLSSLILYYLFKGSIIVPMCYGYFRGRVYGQENVPKKYPLVVVSNHASYFDPPLLASCIGRPVAFMAKEELFKVPLLKEGIRLYGAYPVKRGAGDRSAIRSALTALKDGWLVGIFLQGTRTIDGGIDDPKLGAAMIAAKAQVPLLPVSLWGTEKILKKGSPIPRPVPLTIRIGEVIQPPESNKRQALETVTQKCATVINELHELGR
ncbi:lysophospholipid acyltransferase family protein [Crocosphaera watsonii WH 8501]|uniref:1-acyl-sn-glycerol-3-phosphate acyltransferase n=4 Tax=Crocosphaera watsonii TaxID=263511 RepID=Q4C6G4_CROWT|nr:MULTISPECIES: lysophospholipid acyltransferase family protein [Crocosphaera]EAM52004.1 1-acyl-sn-glycerol-3-phosphate acyltransferase [Crocosphaera watsonii WH 8501]EHJ13705.1 1-acyl-sn-glycerol-3-phosphate acyltransferase [Crocosphaera watsonii WH 0003]MCH2243531.1 1-acyl-sn-glycerol-3-phosphate acyltransferase [Crocosphaera sp.]CCQ62463.1 1-acyl-sn-glycerol-3-phosphate acyltransferase [Crocosphaera watsonii WH 0401]